VFHPYEDILPYETFSIRLNNDDLPFLREILRNVTDDQYRKLLEGVKAYYPAFSWNVEKGGLAFEYTIATLRRKYMNLKVRSGACRWGQCTSLASLGSHCGSVMMSVVAGEP